MENSFAGYTYHVTIENEGDTTLILKYISSECTTKTAKTVTIKSQGYEQFSWQTDASFVGECYINESKLAYSLSSSYGLKTTKIGTLKLKANTTEFLQTRHISNDGSSFKNVSYRFYEKGGTITLSIGVTIIPPTPCGQGIHSHCR
ncbi:hypothetical protein CBNA_1749 [Coxiella burnetii str. Namibia]|nr:hypothetical protein CBNA_1749 [Coxiella burnetii str. Namibia]